MGWPDAYILTKSGELIDIQWFDQPLKGKNSDVVGLFAMGLDITDRKRIEYALRESEEKYRLFLENFNGIAYQATHTTFIPAFFHGNVHGITGYESADFTTGRIRWDQIIHHDDLAIIHEEGEKLKTIPGYIADNEYRIIHKSGKVKWVRDVGRQVMGDSTQSHFVQGAIYDVTLRREAEDATRAHLYFLENLERINQIVASSADLESVMTDLLRTLADIFQADRAWLLFPCNPDAGFFQIPFEYYKPDCDGLSDHPGPFPISPDVKTDFQDALNTTGSYTRGEGNDKVFPDQCPLIEQFKVQSQLTMILRPQTGDPWLLGIHQCTGTRIWSSVERRLYEEIGRRITDALNSLLFYRNLKAGEARYRTLVSTVRALIVVLDTEGRITGFNKACENCTGYQADEVIGRKIWDLLLIEEETEPVKEVLADLKNKAIPNDFTNFWLTRDGRQRLIHWSNSILYDANGKIESIISTGLDITERQQLEDQLAQAQKLEAIGQLAGGIAHDFNNLLMPILQFNEEAVAKLGKDSPLGKRLAISLQAARQAKSMTSHLLTLGQKQLVESRIININDIITSSELILRRLMRKNIELDIKLSDDLNSVYGDESQINQIFMNLFINAQDAMPRGGRLSIETRNVELDYDYWQHHAEVTPGQYVLLSVSDTGVGMDSETVQRIYEPFFTTKNRGHGTGLGLSTVYGIVKQHQGHIWCYSEPGIGTTFKVYLPALGDAVDEIQHEAIETPVDTDTEKTILIAEDNENVRFIISEILEKAGYKVLISEDAEHAAYLGRTTSEIDLMVSDVVMPGMNGPELYKKIATYHPGLKVLYVSGYTDGIISEHGVISGEFQLLKKPFNAAELRKKVRAVLEPGKKM